MTTHAFCDACLLEKNCYADELWQQKNLQILHHVLDPKRDTLDQMIMTTLIGWPLNYRMEDTICVSCSLFDLQRLRRPEEMQPLSVLFPGLATNSTQSWSSSSRRQWNTFPLGQKLKVLFIFLELQHCQGQEADPLLHHHGRLMQDAIFCFKNISFDDPQNGGHFSCGKPVPHLGTSTVSDSEAVIHLARVLHLWQSKLFVIFLVLARWRIRLCSELQLARQ